MWFIHCIEDHKIHICKSVVLSTCIYYKMLIFVRVACIAMVTHREEHFYVAYVLTVCHFMIYGLVVGNIKLCYKALVCNISV